MTSRESDSASEARDEKEFFARLEREFLRLRGKSTVLSPADWELACEWWARGIPLELIVREMDRLFARQRERGSKRGISSLRYFRAAVEAAWSELQEVRAGGYRVDAGEEFDPGAALRRLSESLPEDFAGKQRWSLALRELAGEQLPAHAMEPALAELEARLLEEVLVQLSPGERQELERAAERAWARVAEQVSGAESARVRTALRHQILRRKFSLPRLTLFSTD